MSLFTARLPQAPSNWSKAWADRSFSTIELLMSQISVSAEENSKETSERQGWFLS